MLELVSGVVGRFCIGASSPYFSLVAKVCGGVIGDDVFQSDLASRIPSRRLPSRRTFAPEISFQLGSYLMSRSQNSNRSSRGQNLPAQLQQVHLHAAGIDIGSEAHWVAVPAQADEKPVRKFGAFTGDLEQLANWLQQCGIETVVMESTGVYWIPLFELLEARGFEVWLVDSRKLKSVPGRKTDVVDCQWLQQLHTFGLLSHAFRPEERIAILRAYLRHRAMLVQYSAQHIQHMQKALQQMNVRLDNVLSDITSLTGLQILDAILGGERDPHKLAHLRDPRCANPEEVIAQALHGNWREEHLFALRQARELYRLYHQQIAACDDQIQAYLATFEDQTDGQPLPPGPRHGKHRTTPNFDTRQALYRLTGTDLTQIDGLDGHSALKLIAEIGTDMSLWPTVKHFTSWLSLCPGNKVSGGRRLSSRTKRSSNRAREILRQAVNGLHRSTSALGAFLRRMKTRLGGPAGITAAAHKLARTVYNVLKHGWKYEDKGQAWYEEQFRDRQLKSLQRKALQLGYTLIQAPQPS
jgi:transposase